MKDKPYMDCLDDAAPEQRLAKGSSPSYTERLQRLRDLNPVRDVCVNCGRAIGSAAGKANTWLHLEGRQIGLHRCDTEDRLGRIIAQ